MTKWSDFDACIWFVFDTCLRNMPPWVRLFTTSSPSCLAFHPTKFWFDLTRGTYLLSFVPILLLHLLLQSLLRLLDLWHHCKCLRPEFLFASRMLGQIVLRMPKHSSEYCKGKTFSMYGPGWNITSSVYTQSSIQSCLHASTKSNIALSQTKKSNHVCAQNQNQIMLLCEQKSN